MLVAAKNNAEALFWKSVLNFFFFCSVFRRHSIATVLGYAIRVVRHCRKVLLAVLKSSAAGE